MSDLSLLRSALSAFTGFQLDNGFFQGSTFVFLNFLCSFVYLSLAISFSTIAPIF